jgi:hypothetical protein
MARLAVRKKRIKAFILLFEEVGRFERHGGGFCRKGFG